MKFRRDSWLAEWRIHVAVIAILLIIFLPMYLMLNISFKDNAQFMRNPWLPSWPLHGENWVQAWNTVGRYVSNTVFVAITAIVVTLFLTLPAAYFFARFKVPGSRLLWYFFLILMLMPSVANLIPVFMLIKNAGLLNTLFALIIIEVSAAQVFQIFILRNFIEDLPSELFEAAEMDGASHWQIIWNVVVPMSGSIIATLAILQTIGVWNDFIMPMVIISDDAKLTLAAGIAKLNGEYVKQWGQMMACFAIASVPLVLIFLFAMRAFVKGLSAGAVKG